MDGWKHLLRACVAHLDVVRGGDGWSVAVRRVTTHDAMNPPIFKLGSDVLRNWQRHRRFVEHARHDDAGVGGI